MSNHRRLSRRQAERIIDASASPDHVVGSLLDALRAPARASELRRESAMLAAFHTARLTPPTSTRSDMSTTPRSAATRAAIATGVVVALSTGGFALAATDHLPTLPDQASDQATGSVAKNRATSAPSATATTTATTDATATATATTTATTTESTSTAPETTESASSAPTPNLTGLCKAFQANDKSLHGKALDSSAFTALAAAAGGKENVATYCVTLVGEPKVKPTKEPKPTKEAKPTKEPKTKEPKTKEPKPTAQPTPAVKGKSEAKGKSAGKGKADTAGKH